MKLPHIPTPLLQLVLFVLAFVLAGVVVLAVVDSIGERSRDTARVSAIHSLQTLLSLYASNNGGNYPPTLSALVPTYLPILPTEPLSGSPAGYSYAALGSSTDCFSYHLGVSMENTLDAALNTDADDLPQQVCAGSAPDFSGLSSNPAGEACGTDDVTVTGKRESCYDVTP